MHLSAVAGRGCKRASDPVTDLCGLCDLGFGNRTWGLYKSNKFIYPFIQSCLTL